MPTCDKNIPVSHMWNEKDYSSLGHWAYYAQSGDIYQCPHCQETIKVLVSAASLGRKGGQSTSEAKRAASAKNGKRGGRPPKANKPPAA